MMAISAEFLTGCKPSGPPVARLPPLPVRARVEGLPATVNFASGRPVKRGDLRYTIDDQPFKSALAQALGQLAQ
jgi:multidrug efflux pump subunit AcrA (membrane-fusion protein)